MKKLTTLIALLLTCVIFADAQKSPRPTTKNKPATIATTAKLPIIFAVISDGQAIDPIAFVEKGKLSALKDEDGKDYLNDNYYKLPTTYKLIFGGTDTGKITVKEGAKGECSGNIGTNEAQSEKAKLKGLVMALATDLPMNKKVSGLRRMPTATERNEIEKLVRAEFSKQKVSANTLKTMNYHNLTALDVNNDGKPELVGSYFISPTKTERGLLFFIAEKNASGGYVFGHSKYEKIMQDKVMSNDIKDVDTGILNELLLDVFDYDNDGTSEIFTVGQAFEGNNYYVYKKTAGKWSRVFETYSYRCGY